jgi:hypothetical protein
LTTRYFSSHCTNVLASPTAYKYPRPPSVVYSHLFHISHFFVFLLFLHISSHIFILSSAISSITFFVIYSSSAISFILSSSKSVTRFSIIYLHLLLSLQISCHIFKSYRDIFTFIRHLMPFSFGAIDMSGFKLALEGSLSASLSPSSSSSTSTTTNSRRRTRKTSTRNHQTHVTKTIPNFSPLISQQHISR